MINVGAVQKSEWGGSNGYHPILYNTPFTVSCVKPLLWCPSACPSHHGWSNHGRVSSITALHTGADCFLICHLWAGAQRARAISRHSLIESQVLGVQWYTDHTVSQPVDKACCWRIGRLHSRWGHVDKGLTSSSGWYSVNGTLPAVKDNR